ncbi:hypothetical protein LEP1GSC021_2540 [Leptospira noguchii str. 1993005606]|nr:hypothetical protein [Leptospira noguchii]EMM98484.1 hypothetical protein LEP1GSC035_0540 [Leptospira noguchii str. 2007001578]EPE84985.1 hypothetical protein LEP1GSC021_2540 [Leptospira noguchii str. 1993005606]
MNKNFGEVKYHSILERPYEYKIVGFNFQDDLNDFQNSFIELTLQKKSDIKILKFLQPSGIQIEDGFPSPTGGLCILDISERQWEDKLIEVTDFEASHGAIHFFAKSVIKELE